MENKTPVIDEIDRRDSRSPADRRLGPVQQDRLRSGLVTAAMLATHSAVPQETAGSRTWSRYSTAPSSASALQLFVQSKCQKDPTSIAEFSRAIRELPEVLECHAVLGAFGFQCCAWWSRMWMPTSAFISTSWITCRTSARSAMHDVGGRGQSTTSLPLM